MCVGGGGGLGGGVGQEDGVGLKELLNIKPTYILTFNDISFKKDKK